VQPPKPAGYVDIAHLLDRLSASAHHRAVKALLVICALAGLALGIGASCGPQRSFCPNNPPDYNCIINSEAGALGGNGGNGGSRCPDGGSPNVGGGSCTCVQIGQMSYPCAF
jgi:hypothetical protein